MGRKGGRKWKMERERKGEGWGEDGGGGEIVSRRGSGK